MEFTHWQEITNSYSKVYLRMAITYSNCLLSAYGETPNLSAIDYILTIIYF